MKNAVLAIAPLARALVASACITCTSLAAARAAPGGTEDWNQTLLVNGSHLYGASIAVDAADDLYVTGSYPNATIVTAKLDRAGNLLWQVEFDNPSTREQGAWIAIDADGNALVAGYLVSGSSRTPSGLVVLKYDPAGTLLWSDVTPAIHGVAVRIASDAARNVVVFGSAWLTNSSGFTTEDLVTIQYSQSGAKLWTRTAGVGTTTSDYPGSLAIDAAGNVFVSGGTLGTALTESYDQNGNLRWSSQTSTASTGWDIALGPAGDVYVAAPGNAQLQVIKYDAAGSLQWSNGYSGVVGTRLKLDSASNVIVTGYMGTGGYTDWITHKIAPDGTLLWSAIYDRHQYNDEMPFGLVIGPDDEIYITGQGGPGPTTGTLSYLKTVTVRYSKDGVEDWYSANDLSLRGLGVVRLSDNSIASVGESTFTVFHYVQTGVWTSLDGAVAGSTGRPRLQGTGYPVGGASVSLELSQSLPTAPVWLIVGLTRIDLPFKGGVFVPSPDFMVAGLTVSGGGTLSLPGTWPTGLPSGFEVAAQFWIVDPTGPFGMTASNGLLAVSE